jgi:F0F1-type ATP synthase epsilon subunit
MQLLIAKVDETLFSGEVYSVTLPSRGGEITVQGGHMPLATSLTKGVIRVRVSRESEFQEFPITSGVLEVSGDGATVLL